MKLSIILESNRKAAVAVITCQGKVLLGQSTAKDDRKGLWCFPGGGVKKFEPSDRAATREAKEEMGVTSRVIAGPIKAAGKPNVEFYHCKASSLSKPDPNKEFNACGWFTPREMRGLKLYHNVKEILARFDIS